MNELLIPFGIHLETGEIIEPEDAPSGRACNCLCPGCRAPLLSRHPKVKRYHFAHDSRRYGTKPEEDCPFNSALAVAMMAREITTELAGKILETPPLKDSLYCSSCGGSDKVQVSLGAINTIDQAEAHVNVYGHHADLMLEVGGYTLLLDLVYKGKPPVSPNTNKLQADKVALLTLDCDSFSISSFKRDRNLRFSEAVLDFILRDGVKAWAFHPKTLSKLEKARRNHQCVKPTFYVGSVGAPIRRRNPLPEPIGERCESDPKHYQCVICGVEWIHDVPSAPRCPKCQNSHLYAREID
ncbi:hypothetical protein [Marinimicrobium agarilyticum]|uniref:hypothetical protein n=1 Tax=Marinimicrobium agarilyticum TaxID=306546 RepID=UPI0012F705E0|nr:hypothetical protein [Marinimicrobium agarilyticum]